MKLILREFDLFLKHAFNIAHDSRTVQKTLIVELKAEENSGFGEATRSVYYHNSIEQMVEVLEKNRDIIESYNYEPPEIFWEKLNPFFKGNSFALSAVDCAINDLYAKYQGKSLIDLWKLDNTDLPLSNYTIGIDEIPVMVEKLKEFSWPLYKIKLGTNEDIEIIKELRKHTKASFRVDANCGWGVDETIRNSKIMKEMGVEFIEQPLNADDWEGMKTVYKKSDLPIIADESIVAEADVKKCVDHFHGVNIKLMKCGGLTPTRRMIDTARKLGLKTMVGCMTESSVGIAAVAQLLPLLDYVDMDGALLISNDIAKGPVLANNRIELPQHAGIGIETLMVS